MKRTYLILIPVVFILGGCANITNYFWKDDSIVVSVVGDGSDPLLVNPQIDQVLSIYRLDNDDRLYDQSTLRYRCISDVSQSNIRYLNVPKVSPFFATGIQRVRELKDFKQQLHQVFEEGEKQDLVASKKSCIYPVLVEEANANMGIKGAEHYLIVYSNMLDNDKDLNFYSQVVLDEVQARPMEVISSLCKVAQLKSMKGLRLIIVFQSQRGDSETERKFLIASKFYRTLFENAGAKCVIVPSLGLAQLNDSGNEQK